MRSTRSTHRGVERVRRCLRACSSAPVGRAARRPHRRGREPSPSRALDQVLPTVRRTRHHPRTDGLHGPTRRGWRRDAAAGRAANPSNARRLRQRRLPAAEGRVPGEPGAIRGEPVVGRRTIRTARRSQAFSARCKFATADDAQAFFAASADKWHRCNGQTLVLHQPEHGADGLSRITDVVVDSRIVSAVVLRDDGSTIQRALGVASDCVVDVEVTNVARQQRQRRGGCRRCRQSDAAEDRRFVNPQRAEPAKIDG